MARSHRGALRPPEGTVAIVPSRPTPTSQRKMMRLPLVIVACVGLSSALPTSASRAVVRPHVSSRRAALGLAGSAAVGVAVGGATPALAADPSVKVYFGAGCFWHVQHEVRPPCSNSLSHKDLMMTFRSLNVCAVCG